MHLSCILFLFFFLHSPFNFTVRDFARFASRRIENGEAARNTRSQGEPAAAWTVY